MQKARLAEQAERYDDMAAAMKSVSPLEMKRIEIFITIRLNVNDALPLLSLRKGSLRKRSSRSALPLAFFSATQSDTTKLIGIIIITFGVFAVLWLIHPQITDFLSQSGPNHPLLGRCLSVGRAVQSCNGMPELHLCVITSFKPSLFFYSNCLFVNYPLENPTSSPRFF